MIAEFRKHDTKSEQVNTADDIENPGGQCRLDVADGWRGGERESLVKPKRPDKDTDGARSRRSARETRR